MMTVRNPITIGIPIITLHKISFSLIIETSRGRAKPNAADENIAKHIIIYVRNPVLPL